MGNCKSILCGLGLGLAFAVQATAADAPKLAFKFTANSVPGALQTFPGGVNNKGVTVGQYQDQNSGLHGYILKGKNVITLDDPNGTSTGANNLNPSGAIRVVGAYVNSSGASVGFLYKSGEYTDIPGPTGAIGTTAAGINDSGAIVGYYADSAGITHGFLLAGETYTTLDVPGAIATYATGINKKGTIVLYWMDSSGVLNSSVYNGTTYNTINVPKASGSAALDLNTAGDVTYEWMDPSGAAHGALLHGGKYYKFDFPKAKYTYAGGINDKHTIAGGYEATSEGPFQGFNATYK